MEIQNYNALENLIREEWDAILADCKAEISSLSTEGVPKKFLKHVSAQLYSKYFLGGKTINVWFFKDLNWVPGSGGGTIKVEITRGRFGDSYLQENFFAQTFTTKELEEFLCVLVSTKKTARQAIKKRILKEMTG